MSTKITSELKLRITVLLILWAVICLTALPHRSTILNSKMQADTRVEQIIDYVVQM